MIPPDITMKEKKEILEDDRKVREGSTYFAHAQASAQDEMGGRFAKVQPTSVTGSSPGAWPKMPEGNFWAKNEMPPEPRWYSWIASADHTEAEIWIGMEVHFEQCRKEIAAAGVI